MNNIYINKLIFAFLYSSIFVFGQNIQDIEKLKSEYQKYQLEQNITAPPTQKIQIENQSGDLPSMAQFKMYNREALVDSQKTYDKFFGYNFFTKRDTVAFWENLPAPPDYMLGPGDEIVISLWGETQLRKTYIISREGKIFDDKVGTLLLSGKNIIEGEKFLKKQFGRVYSTINGSLPSTYIDVSLGQLRTINVNFVGQVNFPGVYPIHPFSTVITGLIQAGGIDTTASLRKIEIKRKGQSHAIIDLYDYLIKGNLPKNIQLRDQDIIIVPVREIMVTIDSSVIRPGIYEGLYGESIKDIVDYSGGLKPEASSKLGLNRIIKDPKDKFNFITKSYYINYSNSHLSPIANGDLITVYKKPKTLNQVEIIGQVLKPGKFYYFDGMKVKDLVELSGGFNDPTFWKSVYQEQAEIIRRDPKTSYEKIIKIDLKKLIIEDSESENIDLLNFDRFIVHANRNFFKKMNVDISGEVKIPGSYPIIKDKESLSSLLLRAGGKTEKALKNGITIFRDKKYLQNLSSINTNRLEDNSSNSDEKNSDEENINRRLNDKSQEKQNKVRLAWESEEIVLMPGDSIIIKEKTNTIYVFGEVYNPGLVEFNKNKPLKYYINSAGGLTERGNKKGIIVIYANGLVVPKKWYKSPKIEDGVTIIINEKRLPPPFDITQFASNWTQIISSLVSVVILSRQI
jgi:protein involved in polysaccharide export with SLBB domain